MKMYMLCDMEGASGICCVEHCWRTESFEQLYQEGRRLLTKDINRACAAALSAGVDELVVCDTHSGGGRNILWDDLLVDPRITYEGPGGASRLLPSLDRMFDGLILLGHHAKAGTEDAFLDHTWSGDWFDFRINGTSVGEIGIEASVLWSISILSCVTPSDRMMSTITFAPSTLGTWGR